MMASENPKTSSSHASLSESVLKQAGRSYCRWILFLFCLLSIAILLFRLGSVVDKAEVILALSAWQKTDLFPPCGEICSYETKRIQNVDSEYPSLKKRINCNNIMRRMAYKNQTVIRPTPREPPTELKAAFEQFGDSPITGHRYFGRAPLPNRTRRHARDSGDAIREFMDKAARGENINPYGDNKCMMDMIAKYKTEISGVNTLIVGTIIPWLESLLLLNGAGHVLTLEYGRIRLYHEQITTNNPYDFAEMFLAGTDPDISFAASFSSLEHSGLGRYGDPMNPYGDMEAAAQVWCVLKPGGIFVLGVPGSADDSSYIVWNAHRVYGSKRIQHLIANWELMEHTHCTDGYKHIIMVLRKPY